MSKLLEFLKDESGASAAEYVLIIAVVGGALSATLLALNGAMDAAIDRVVDFINPAP